MMVFAVAFLLAISADAIGEPGDDNQKRMITNTDHSGQCVYSHSNGDMELYGCNAGYNDQKFYLQQVSAADVGGRTNGYIIKSADNGLCLATQDDEKIFGWSDCSTSD